MKCAHDAQDNYAESFLVHWFCMDGDLAESVNHLERRITGAFAGLPTFVPHEWLRITLSRTTEYASRLCRAQRPIAGCHSNLGSAGISRLVLPKSSMMDGAVLWRYCIFLFVITDVIATLSEPAVWFQPGTEYIYKYDGYTHLKDLALIKVSAQVRRELVFV